MGLFGKISLSLFAPIILGAISTPALGRKLPALGADATRVSVSGLSSGAFMAVQYGVAFSGSTMGVGVVAGGPYNCAFVNFGGIFTCMQSAPAGRASYDAAIGFALIGQIDPVSNIKAQKIYLFSGTKDEIVHQSAMNAVRDFYRVAGVPDASLLYVSDFPAGHAFISAGSGNACDITATPYVDQCAAGGTAYDQPAAILGQIYGPMQPKAAAPSAKPVAFDQSEFSRASSGMAKTGYVYVPADCAKAKAAKCAVHVVFHGCQQSADVPTVKDAIYGRLGYNEWADTNRIIMLYPQVEASDIPFNKQGCWDWWGYSGLNFQTQGGPQLAAVRAMVKRLTM